MEEPVTYRLQKPFAVRRTPGVDYASLLYNESEVARMTILPWTDEGELISLGAEAAEMFLAGMNYAYNRVSAMVSELIREGGGGGAVLP